MQLIDNPVTPVLQAYARRSTGLNLKTLMNMPGRAESFIHFFEDLRVDITRQPVTTEILRDLRALAEAAHVEAQRDAMLSGALINNTEHRPVEHVKLRDPARRKTPEWVKLTDFVEKVRSEKKIHTIINIGIGGSDLGSAMVAVALAPFSDGPEVRYVSNIDPADLHDKLRFCQPETSLFIITSKTFTTEETLDNARRAKEWLMAGGIDPNRAMVAVTAAPDKAVSWGLDTARIFDFSTGVGGRNSVWSAVGLSVMMSIGIPHFKDFLDGAHSLDQHFATAPLHQNIPVLLALLRVWNRNFLHRPAHGIMPYDYCLRRLPIWAQQLEMESNGKSVDRQGIPLKMPASPLIWGASGLNAQHSFFQYLHQGLEINPIDILVPTQPRFHTEPWQQAQKTLIANVLAQAESLATGCENIHEPHRHFAGNRPSTILSWDRTTPYALGRLLALYEHITIICGFIWDINSFDQWGVELGKKFANELQSGQRLDQFSPAALNFSIRSKHQ